MVSAGVQIIEYEIVNWSDLDHMGDFASTLGKSMKIGSEVGILRCVTSDGRRVNFAGHAASVQALIAQREASLPQGIAIPKSDFPVMLEGWPYRLRNTR